MRPDDKTSLLNICKTIGVRAWWCAFWSFLGFGVYFRPMFRLKMGHFPSRGTECLIAAHLKRPEFGDIQMVADNAYGVPIIRPTAADAQTWAAVDRG